MNAVIEIIEEENEVTPREMKAEVANAAASLPLFLALYGPRGPMTRLIEYGEIDREMFALCGVKVTELRNDP